MRFHGVGQVPIQILSDIINQMPLIVFIQKVKAFFAAAGSFLNRVIRKPQFLNNFIIKIKKRRLVLLGAAGAALLVFAVVLIFSDNSAEEKRIARVSGAFSGAGRGARVIPPEEIFLPDEPDFLPGVLTEREQRTIWTGADAAPYWRDPLKYGEENWRKRVEAVIDELLENVP